MRHEPRQAIGFETLRGHHLSPLFFRLSRKGERSAMERPLGIAVLHYSCPPVVGGVEEVVRQQASVFHRHGHPVKILAGSGSAFTEKYPVEINPLLGSRNSRVAEAQRGAGSHPEALDALTDRIERYLCALSERFDVLIAHNVLTMHYNLPLTRALHRLADRGEIAVVGWNHDSPFFYDDAAPHLSQPGWAILKRYNPNIAYVTISEARRRQFQELYGGEAPLAVIPNGIDPIRFFRLDRSTVRLIREARLFEADFLLVQPSRLHPRKNIEMSIRVIRALQDRGLGARLLLTGAYDPHEEATVEYYRKLRALAEELAVSEDILVMAEYFFESGEKLSADRITIRDLYLIADMLFLPSSQEGFGIPLLEAGMIKLPIVCSDIEPFREVGGQDVCLFSLDETPEAVAERILGFAERLQPHRMYRRVIRNYVWDNIYNRKLLPYLKWTCERRD
ncbi:MAG: hypothetical protein Kow0092_09620 [Deferrisomatales bacterium]